MFDQLVRFYAARFQVAPELARAQMMQESHGDPKAHSKVGAVGLFQVMPSTAAWLETMPEPAIMTGVWYLRYLYNQVQDATSDEDHWKFALAAYNEGPGALDKSRTQCKAAGKDPNKWEDVSAFVPSETRAYVAVIWRNYQPAKAAAAPLPIDPEISQ